MRTKNIGLSKILREEKKMAWTRNKTNQETLAVAVQSDWGRQTSLHNGLKGWGIPLRTSQ